MEKNSKRKGWRKGNREGSAILFRVANHMHIFLVGVVVFSPVAPEGG
tara:strand:+ start:433 stop:573 length:141 start_codon:yes stop_codon:yes gene_type:complete